MHYEVPQGASDRDIRILVMDESGEREVYSNSDTAIAVMSAGQHLDGSRSHAIGYAPRVSLEETVDRALRWFKAQGMC